MRTKITILAAAALAAGVFSSQAQVYSANIVGYVNQTLPANTYNLLVSSFQASSSNNAEQVLSSLQTGDAVLLWNGAGYSSSVFVGAGTWIDGGTGDPVNAPLLPVGVGYFYQTGAGVNETNTFVGTVVLTNSISLPANAYKLVGSSTPIAGSVESTNFNLPFQTGDAVLFWTGSGYSSSVFVGAGTWIDGGTGDPVAVPSLTVGKGFFYQTGAGVPETWNQHVVVP